MLEYFIEYLPRLKTTSIQINLPKDEIKSVKINDDSIIINSSTSIKLPKIIDSSKTIEKVIPISLKYTNIRLQEMNPGLLVNDSVESLLQDQYQWNINNLKKYHLNDTIQCNKCTSNLIKLNEVSKFLPMPSELWYEMLDFWHCHKPNVNNENDKNIGLLKKFNQLKPNFKNLIIGSYYFILNPEDWENIKLDNNNNNQLICNQCNENLGNLDVNIGNFKLLKWELKLDNVNFKPYSYISLKLIEEMNFTATRFFKIINESNDNFIQVWCFGLGIDISIPTLGSFQNCLKILYRNEVTNNDNNGEILIEYEKPFDDFINLINKMNIMLPENLQNYKDWKVSYIPI